MKLHLEHQIEQICQTVTKLAPHGDLLMMTSSNDRATSSHGQGGSQLLSSGGRQLETKTSSASEGSEEDRWCSRIKRSIGLKISSGSEGSDEERWCSRIKRASHDMCKYADDWERKMQDHWDACRRKNALERSELRFGMGEEECDKVKAKEKEKNENVDGERRKHTRQTGNKMHRDAQKTFVLFAINW